MSLFVGNLYISILKRYLNEVFGQFGKCKIDLKKKYAFIDYNEYSHAEKAIKQLNGTTLNGYNAHLRKIECFKCKSEGHIAKDCPYIRDQSDDQSSQKIAVNNSSSVLQGNSNSGVSRPLLSPPGLTCQDSYSSKVVVAPNSSGKGSSQFKFDVSSMLSSLNKTGGRNSFQEVVPNISTEERKKGGIPLYKAHTFHDDKYQDSKILKQATEKLGEIHQNPSLITVQQNLQPHQLIQYQIPSNQPRFVAEKMENIDQISNLSISQLKKRLRTYGQPTSGSKYMLIDRVKDFLSTQIK